MQVFLRAPQQRTGERRMGLVSAASMIAAPEHAQLAVGERDHVVMRERREQLADEARRMDQRKNALGAVLVDRRDS